MECILCGSSDFERIFFLKNGPRYAQKLLSDPQARGGERIDIPLYKCRACDMVQIDTGTLSHDQYFDDYLMTRTGTELYTRYEDELAVKFYEKYNLRGKNVIEAGCGDGYFAAKLNELGARVEAIEPSATARAEAEKRGVKCYDLYLGDDTDKHLTKKYDAFVSKQAMDLVKNPNSFLRGMGKLLNFGAIGLVDVPSWTKTLFDMRYFDVLPDRVSYFTANTLTKIMERNNFHVIEVYHGADDEYVGVFVCYQGSRNGLEDRFSREYQAFGGKFEALMASLNAAGKSVGAWGAGAKGVTVFSFTGMNPQKIKYVIDKDSFKQGKYLPGSLLKIVPPDTLEREPVDALIVTAAMFYREIIRELYNQRGYRGDIIILTPEPRILSRDEIEHIIGGK